MEILILAGLILLNGLFSMAEIALVSARKSRLEAQAGKGDKEAREALNLANKPETFLSTVQMGITVIGILTGIYSGEKITDDFAAFLKQWPFLAKYSYGLATVIVVIIVTYFSIIFGELVPKRLGLTKPEGIAKAVAKPMRILSLITHPFIWLLSKSSNLIISIFSLKPADNSLTEEEIKAIISEGTEQGTIEETEQEIIERVFHLSDRNITSLMTHRSDIIWFNQDDTEEKIKEKIMGEPHSIYPICDGEIDNLKGVVSIKDLYVSPDNRPFKELMQPALFVPENNTAFQVMEKFKQSKLHSCFIVDEYGTILGMITLNDILEAIIGDMPQPDVPDYEIIEREDGTYLVDAQIPFYDFLTRFEKAEWMNEGEQEFDTLAGFVLHELERIPHTGDKLEWKGFTLEIIDMDGHRIDKVLVKLSDTLREEMEEERG
ncbi:hemolysin family protein [Terrimonas sp. NA20]|uniref:Hemolysin family protein n=1 Tax=Terrimonas ginsenosidimutans TaxID=2908004 RepID=A0ABS9KZH9_9BACT|nr:hemolysin family protein [Terrimonas ginsenosidimutans]MCG2617734.1 hemolysin family protein [Terrimonas ginsenosidimutans]